MQIALLLSLFFSFCAFGDSIALSNFQFNYYTILLVFISVNF